MLSLFPFIKGREGRPYTNVKWFFVYFPLFINFYDVYTHTRLELVGLVWKILSINWLYLKFDWIFFLYFVLSSKWCQLTHDAEKRKEFQICFQNLGGKKWSRNKTRKWKNERSGTIVAYTHLHKIIKISNHPLKWECIRYQSTKLCKVCM